MKRYLKPVVFIGTLLVSPSAFASAVFPSVVQDELSMVCPPACTLCHTTDPGEAGTVSQPFALWLVGRGLTAKDEKSLKKALESMAVALPDSDQDMFDDLTELKSSVPSNPNDVVSVPGDPIGICDAEFNYGCGATIARPNKELPHSSWFGFAVLGVGVAALLRTRFSRRRSARS